MKWSKKMMEPAFIRLRLRHRACLQMIEDAKAGMHTFMSLPQLKAVEWVLRTEMEAYLDDA